MQGTRRVCGFGACLSKSIPYGRGGEDKEPCAPAYTDCFADVISGFRVCRRMLFRSMCISVMIGIVARSERRL